MPIDLPSPTPPAEGTSLPPPRPFGEANTLTLAQARTGGDAQIAIGALMAACGQPQSLRAAILPASADALTITF